MPLQSHRPSPCGSARGSQFENCLGLIPLSIIFIQCNTLLGRFGLVCLQILNQDIDFNHIEPCLALKLALDMMADTLGDFVQFLAIPADKRMILTDSETGVERQLLSPTFEGRGIEFMYHIIAKGASTGLLPPAKPGVEKYMVIEKGTLKVTLGEDVYELNEGDAFFYEADIAHSYENIGRSECRYYIVVSTSRR